MASKTDSTNSHHCRKEKVDRTFFDTDFFSDAKIQFLIAKFGAVATAYYLRIALAILSEGGSLHELIAHAFIEQLGASPETTQGFFEATIKVGLFYKEGETIRSHRADREIEQLLNKRDKWRKDKDRPKTPPQPTTDSTDVPPGIQADSTKSPKDSEEEEEGEQDKELEGEPGKRKGNRRRAPKYRDFNPADFEWPPAWDERAIEQMRVWIEYKSETINKPCTLKAYQAQVDFYAKTPSYFIDGSAKAIREEYQGIPENRGYTKRATAPPGDVAPNGYSHAFNHNLELIRRAEEAERDE